MKLWLIKAFLFALLICSGIGLAASMVALVAALFSGPAGAAEAITGRASVIDGDTIEIAGTKIRLNGIDAPESWQQCHDAAGREYRCGKDAAKALDEYLAASRPTSCTVTGHDRYKRSVATCRRSDGGDVNAWMVANGWAVDWVRYSKGDYAQDQLSARARGAGIWRGDFEMPCEARGKRAGRAPSC